MKKERLHRGKNRAGATFPLSPGKATLPDDYPALFQEIKTKVQQTRLHTILAANAAMIRLYWEIGQSILERQGQEGWGSKVVDRLASDLRNTFPDMRGFSPSNLKYMRRFAEECPARTIGQQPADQLPWFHIVMLITRLSNTTEREWYAAHAIHYGWSRNILALQIDGRAHQRHGKAISDFYIDLLFYHLRLRCFVVVELKAVAFDAAFVGKLNVYLSAVDDLLRHPDDKPTIGLLLCRSKNKLVVEYALRDLRKPIGVAQWETKLTRSLPKNLKSSMPSIEEIEAEMQSELGSDNR